MTPYDSHATIAPFVCSLSAFEKLTRTLSGADASAWTHAGLEEHLDVAGRDLLRLLLQDHRDLRARREAEQVRAAARLDVVGPEGCVRPWRETGHSRWPATVFGLVRVTRVAHQGPGLGNVHPADGALSLPAGRHSTALRRLAVTEAVRGSFDHAHAAVTRRRGNMLGKHSTASLVRSPEQVIADAFDQAQARDPKHLRPWAVLVDGAHHQLDLITAESIRRGVTLHVLLDFVHVAEYVWAAAHTFHKPGTTEAEEWAADHLAAILAGHAARTADQMTAQAA